eukprot:TRINITY_DN3489_c0_g1_i1.p1 TRINITY_DN3489_c0_g1~~TRINITY_DN3489_c0_g1_i1.p1  ORF type:complete len:941 (-),score=410.29 TRINITY_DN3489_c0_g1_i1:111-2933(-)
MSTERPCSLIINCEKGDFPNTSELKEKLEKGSIKEKIATMKKILFLMQAGEKLPQLLVPIIRFITTSKDKPLKKLALLYFDAAEKKGPDNKLLQEMILLCNALMLDMNHPNEYVRGCTLRFVSKLREAEIIEPLLPTIKSNLEHRHAFVRRNAITALHSIYADFSTLLPDAPDIVFNFLQNEGDASCKRNAFLMLSSCCQEKAIEYLLGVVDQVTTYADTFQFIAIDLIRKVCKSNHPERSRFIRCMLALVGSSSAAVRYESATALMVLSSAPTAIHAAASTFIELLCNQSDNNVKMIVLDRLLEIKQKHSKVLQGLLLDVMRALSCPNMDIRKKTLDFALDLVSLRNIDEVVLVLKKEIAKTQSQEEDKAAEYRQLLVQAIHSCAVRFSEIAGSVVDILIEFLSDTNGNVALTVAIFVKEVIETYPNLRQSILRQILQILNQIKISKVCRAALWTIGEFSQSIEDIDGAFTAIRNSLGDLQKLLVPEETEQAPKETKTLVQTSITRVLSDGTYASQSALVDSAVQRSLRTETNSLKSLLLVGDFFFATTLVTTLTKLVLKLQTLNVKTTLKNSFCAEVVFIATEILLLGKSPNIKSIDSDSYERIGLCIRLLSEPSELLREIFIVHSHNSFAEMLREQKEKIKLGEKPKEVTVQVDDLLKLRQLTSQKAGQEIEEENTPTTKSFLDIEKNDKKPTRVYQLTGFSDPIYAEANVVVHQYDILLDVMVMNLTNDTLQNVSLELSTMGDLKLVEKPQTYTIGPNTKRQIKTTIKVSSTETGIIFGNIVYDIAGKATTGDRNIVILNDIHIDIIDYISAPSPTSLIIPCTDSAFRAMWAEFEWENKVAVNTSIQDLNEFLDHILKSTNMQCLTTRSPLDSECGFLAANLYAKSIFGEDALANVCVEKATDGKISGCIRIRSKTQGIALSLGDKITLKQKSIEA